MTSTNTTLQFPAEPDTAPSTIEIPLPERLPWNEIQARYPDQWVVMVNTAWERGQPQAGRVLYAGKKVKDTLHNSRHITDHLIRFAFVFTGQVRLRKPLFEVLYG